MSRFFDGIDDDITFTSGIDPNSGAFSACLWIYVQSFSNLDVDNDSSIILQQKDGTGTGRAWMFIRRFVGPVYNLMSFIGAVNVIGTTDWNNFVGSWHHVAVTVSGGGASSTLKLWIDGVLEATDSTIDPEACNGDHILGKHKAPSGANEEFNGSMAQVHIYGRELSKDEIKQASIFPGSIQNSLKSFLMLWGTASPEFDYSGNGTHGTVSGATRGTTEPPVSGMYRIKRSKTYYTSFLPPTISKVNVTSGNKVSMSPSNKIILGVG